MPHGGQAGGGHFWDLLRESKPMPLSPARAAGLKIPQGRGRGTGCPWVSTSAEDRRPQTSRARWGDTQSSGREWKGHGWDRVWLAGAGTVPIPQRATRRSCHRQGHQAAG